MSDAAVVSNTPERREVFRAYMRAFNPTAPALEVIRAGLVVEDLHQSLHKNLAARADLEPGSQQLVVGGIGSGKTTELLLASGLLSQSGKTLPLYIDVTSETDLSGLNSGALIASFGLRLAASVLQRNVQSILSGTEIEDLKVKHQAIKDFAYGKDELKWVSQDEYDYEYVRDDEDQGDPEPPEGYYIHHRTEGKLKRPFPALKREIQEIREPLQAFVEALKKMGLEVVAVFDGLDRLIQPDKFWAVVEQDLRSLRRLNVSVLVTAPISVLYGVGRSITDYFDKVHHLAVIATEPKYLTSLHSLLQKRGSMLLLDSDLAGRICYGSGGVLRDLVTLARDSGEDAYISGFQMIQNDNVEKAILQLGTAYRRGLGPVQIKGLNELAKKGVFNPTSTTSVELLVTRRVLEYSATHFRVHPALAPLLQESNGEPS
jgi:hypothetical protein